MTITFEVQGKNHAEIEKAALDKLGAYLGDGKYDCHLRYRVEPLIETYGQQSPSRWIAQVEITAEPVT